MAIMVLVGKGYHNNPPPTPIQYTHVILPRRCTGMCLDQQHHAVSRLLVTCRIVQRGAAKLYTALTDNRRITTMPIMGNGLSSTTP
jgi:hypothetical protein